MPPPSTLPALPDAFPSFTATVAALANATAPIVDPSARPGTWSFAGVPPHAANTALAITVGTNGPGATARPSCSITTTVSSSV